MRARVLAWDRAYGAAALNEEKLEKNVQNDQSTINRVRPDGSLDIVGVLVEILLGAIEGVVATLLLVELFGLLHKI